MRVLVIDTALGACTAAVFDDATEMVARSEIMARGHQERLGGIVQAVLHAAGGPQTLDRIGVTVGPGSFTGLRVGLAFAQGLGLALDRPVIGLGTLEGLARSINAPGLTAAVIDARREQVYLQLFRDAVALTEPEALSVEAASARIAAARAYGEALTLAGSGAALLAQAWPDARVLPLEAPTPAALAALTVAADADGAARPLYLRPPDAKPPTPKP